MSLKTSVYVGNITNLSDARYCAGMGVDLLGFPIDSHHENRLSSDTYSEISSWVAGVKRVGEIATEVPGEYEVDFYKLGNPSLLDEVHATGVPYIFTLNASNDLFELTSMMNYVQPAFYLLENCSSVKLDAIKAILLESDVPVYVGYDIMEDQVDAYLAVGAQGIAMRGTEEEKPGFKDYDALADLLEYLEV